MTRRPSASALRARRQNRIGAAMLAATAAGFVALFGAAYHMDSSNGVTVSESLASVGIGRAESPAREARLIGRCGGRLMAAMEESSFPAGCAWIKPIREFEAGRAGADHSHESGK
jgi:hypothetical protein